MLLRHNYLEQHKTLFLIFFVTAISLVTLTALPLHPGKSSIYILFTVISNTMLYMAFNKKAIFFDAFIGVFFWLGFWLKFTIEIIYSKTPFYDISNNFDLSPAAFDKGLLVASCGLLALLLVSLVRRAYFNYPLLNESIENCALFQIYKKYKLIILAVFILTFVFICISNVMLGIYQKGSITRTVLPLGLNGVYKWLLLFGLATFSALILRFETEATKKISLIIIIIMLLETFFSSVSQISRGMIFNAGALLYGLLVFISISKIKINLKTFTIATSLFVLLFVISVAIVNYMRIDAFDINRHYQSNQDLETSNKQDESLKVKINDIKSITEPLFLERWVGIEAVFAISSYPSLGWKLFKTSLQEKYNENDTSFYDKAFINSSYINTDKTKHHFISLPGIIAFFFYPGSYWFLFLSMFVLGGFAAFIEYSAYKLGGGNLILCALLAQVVAYRFASFGYVPAQSYLLFGSIYLNLSLIYFAEKIASYFNAKDKLVTK